MSMKSLRIALLIAALANAGMMVSLHFQRRHLQASMAETQKRIQELMDATNALSKTQQACETICGTIHKPNTGCPAGFKEVPDIFERGGEKSPACVNPNRPQCVDVLYPGEQYRMIVPLLPLDSRQESRRRL